MKILFPLAALSIIVVFGACGGDSSNSLLSSGTHCFSWSESTATSSIELEVSSDGQVTGFQQGLLRNGDGEITTSFQVMISGIVDSNTMKVTLIKDSEGFLEESNEVWTLDETGLKTRKLPHTKGSCSDLEFLDESKAIKLQGTWNSTEGSGRGVEIKSGKFSDIHPETPDERKFTSFSMMDSCQRHYNSDGNFIVLINGLCVEIKEFSGDKMVLQYPQLAAEEYKRAN